ncbi:MAG: hypothetical protein JWM85_1610, partial [Acidimicrobiaceae bacterium]|nr:hypothetical protein [Acidimicrobiaceae bacterium]
HDGDGVLVARGVTGPVDPKARAVERLSRGGRLAGGSRAIEHLDDDL